MTSAETILDLTSVADDSMVRSPEWFQKLVTHVNEMLVHDFAGLVNLLYRFDVPEDRIRQAVSANPGTDAANLIARLLLERHLQKLKFRKQFVSPEPISDDEKW